jgi:ATP-dependent DNA helicase RecG
MFQKEGMFIVTLFRPVSDTEQVTHKSREKILELIKAEPSVTMLNLADSLRVSVKAIEKHMASLKKSGRLERVGPDKGGYWRIKEC